ncbi:Cysteine-rich repeat secretory protein 38 [Morella rubra]|uniref:Cysteine-rich repeat secretory protein 38 n=1 Tax=Morella rubra TaxID=262757 RepID=A0A6A1ULP7_9ROSI|nr:Cysteine-rich repeat secretory protein 38 [Morella rubra]
MNCRTWKMHKDELPAMLFIIIPLLILLPITANGDDPLSTFCNPDFNYTRNSPFENNLKLLRESLPSNTSVNGFYSTSVGGDADRVYGQALCRGDVNSTVCRSCVEKASQKILNQCQSEDALIWFELCQVRYSFRMFFASMDYTGKYPEQNNMEKNISHPDRFDRVLTYLMKNISYKAASAPSNAMFATGEIKCSRKQTIYGLVQCTRDMSESDCHTCLQFALGDLRACCSSLEGGIVVSRTCNVRFELYPFYNSSRFLLTYPTSEGKDLKIFD